MTAVLANLKYFNSLQKELFSNYTNEYFGIRFVFFPVFMSRVSKEIVSGSI